MDSPRFAENTSGTRNMFIRRLGALWALWDRSEAVLEPSWTSLGSPWGPSWASLGPSWAPLGLSWRSPGALLGPSWAVLGLFWAILAPSGAVLGPSGAVLGPSRNKDKTAKPPNKHSNTPTPCRHGGGFSFSIERSSTLRQTCKFQRWRSRFAQR